MKREVVVFLVLGSVVISLLEAPSALLSLTRAWNGPYPECRAESPAALSTTLPAAPGPRASSFEPASRRSARAITPALYSPQGPLRPIPALMRASSSTDLASLPSLAEN